MEHRALWAAADAEATDPMQQGMHLGSHTSELSLRAWKIGALCGIVYHSTANRPPRGTPI
eukprot:COSAG01_NODE_5435_length_4274_cov_79.781032_4_plen_59_part_01